MQQTMRGGQYNNYRQPSIAQPCYKQREWDIITNIDSQVLRNHAINNGSGNITINIESKVLRNHATNNHKGGHYKNYRK